MMMIFIAFLPLPPPRWMDRAARKAETLRSLNIAYACPAFFRYTRK